MGVCVHLNLGLKATFKFKGKVILENCDPLDQLPDHSFLVRIHPLPLNCTVAIHLYCEELFPATYGHVIDFMHVYKKDLETIGEAIEWLPMEEAKLVKIIGPCAE